MVTIRSPLFPESVTNPWVGPQLPVTFGKGMAVVIFRLKRVFTAPSLGGRCGNLSSGRIGFANSIRFRCTQHFPPILITGIVLKGCGIMLGRRCVFFQVMGEVQQGMSFTISVLGRMLME